MAQSLYTKLTERMDEVRFVRLLEYLAAQGERPHSVHYLLERVVELGSLKAALDEAEQEMEHTTTVLSVLPRGATRFRVRLGEEGDSIGDGGDWTGLFFANGQVRRVTNHSYWIC